MKIKPGYFECDIERTNFVRVIDPFLKHLLWTMVPYNPDVPLCGHWHENGFVCTRPQDHSGLHIAHSIGEEVVAVWMHPPAA